MKKQQSYPYNLYVAIWKSNIIPYERPFWNVDLSSLLNVESQKALESAVNSLSFTEYTHISLRYKDGLKLQEVASKLEKTTASVSTILRRAILKLSLPDTIRRIVVGEETYSNELAGKTLSELLSNSCNDYTVDAVQGLPLNVINSLNKSYITTLSGLLNSTYRQLRCCPGIGPEYAAMIVDKCRAFVEPFRLKGYTEEVPVIQSYQNYLDKVPDVKASFERPALLTSKTVEANLKLIESVVDRDSTLNCTKDQLLIYLRWMYDKYVNRGAWISVSDSLPPEDFQGPRYSKELRSSDCVLVVRENGERAVCWYSHKCHDWTTEDEGRCFSDVTHWSVLPDSTDLV